MVYQDLFKAESTRGTNTLDTMYRLGLLPSGAERIITPQLKYNYNEIKQIGQHYIDISEGNHPLDNQPARFVPVNGLPYYWLLGAAANPSGTLKRITPFTTSPKPSISLFNHDLNGYIPYECKGNVLMSLDESFEIGSALVHNCNWMGMENGISVATPTDGGFIGSVQSPYNSYLATDAFKWNTIAYPIIGLTRKNVHTMTGYMGDDGVYIEITESASPIISVWTVIFKENTDISLIAADFTARTPRAISNKVYKAIDATKYIEYSQTNALCYLFQQTQMQGQPNRYVGIFVGENIQVDVEDGIAVANYGIA